MGRLLYSLARGYCRFVCFHTQDTTIVHRNRLERPGGYVLACTHLSHLEPVLLSTYMRRTVNWVARIEFYRWRILAWFLNYFDAIPVDRDGHSLPTIRHAIADTRAGHIVGIFPEGGVARGRYSVCRGGPIRRGACTIAYRAGVPIVPVVVIGGDRLDKVLPWIPWRRGALLMRVGEPIDPPVGKMDASDPHRVCGAATGGISRELREAVRPV